MHHHLVIALTVEPQLNFVRGDPEGEPGGGGGGSGEEGGRDRREKRREGRERYKGEESE